MNRRAKTVIGGMMIYGGAGLACLAVGLLWGLAAQLLFIGMCLYLCGLALWIKRED